MGRLVVAIAVSLWMVPVSLLVNHIVPQPYMDEIFHIPQAQQYCKGNFKSWDPKITTPPGLYYLSLVHIASLFPGMFCAKKITSYSELCSASILRSVNGLLAVLCSILVYEIIRLSRPTLDERKATLHAIVLSLYPLHWFFTFLYYTDVASLTMVLAMYLACLKRHFQFSALLGASAIFIRQTNVVWMVYVASGGILNFLMLPSNCKKNAQPYGRYVSNMMDDGETEKKSVLMGKDLRKRKSEISSIASDLSMSKTSASPLHHDSGFLDEVLAILERLWLLKWEVVVSFGPFMFVVLAFFAFVYWNGSVVLGAKEDHTVSPHFAQIMYFGLASALAMTPFCFSFSQVVRICGSVWTNKLRSFSQILASLVAGFIFVHFFSVEHPYLLADNRHYTFYIWRKIIKSHWLMKYLLLPLYVYSWFSICSILGRVLKRVQLLIFFLACAAVLIPTPLVEFRYYTIPFYFLILHAQVDDNRSWLFLGFVYVVVNIFTMWLFLFRPFHWSHEHGTQRFMW